MRSCISDILHVMYSSLYSRITTRGLTCRLFTAAVALENERIINTQWRQDLLFIYIQIYGHNLHVTCCSKMATMATRPENMATSTTTRRWRHRSRQTSGRRTNRIVNKGRHVDNRDVLFDSKTMKLCLFNPSCIEYEWHKWTWRRGAVNRAPAEYRCDAVVTVAVQSAFTLLLLQSRTAGMLPVTLAHLHWHDTK